MDKKIRIIMIVLGVFTLIFWFSRRDIKDPDKEVIATDTDPKVIVSSGTIKRGNTIEQILANENIAFYEQRAIIEALKTEYNPKKIRPGQLYEIYSCTSGAVVEFKYFIDVGEYLSIRRSEEGEFYCERRTVPSEKILTTISGEIQSSLYQSMIAKGIPSEVIMTFTDIFSWQIDFLVEPKEGDIFELAYEEQKFPNNIRRFGKILVARYRGAQTGEQTAIHFEYPDARGAYYDPEGVSLKKAFLRAPLNYRRISSHFTHRRFHPILRRWMPSLAIDYAAPTGTPVVAIADGRVTHTGWGETRKRRGLGIHVIIRHNEVYSTWYSHLSRVARGIRKGTKVRQGQVIGYVGSTGLSTGPHLDFRLQKHGEFVNFLKMRFPPAKSIPAEYRDEFKEVIRERLDLLEMI